MKVLLVDDDVDLLDVTAYALRREGFNVIAATDGMHALQRWESDTPDLIVSDVSMPRMDGLELCQRVRQDSDTPVILLTGLNREDEIIKGFHLGADDYVTKPFSPKQLAMRIRAVYRRSSNGGHIEQSYQLELGALQLDNETHEASYDGEPVRLTPLEFRLLYILTLNSGRVVTSARLVDYGWGYDGGDIALVKTHISHIRKKLHMPKSDIGDIKAVPRIGYRLAGGSAQAPINPIDRRVAATR